MNYSFVGSADSSGEISFTIPPLQKILSEGTYNTRLEVVVDDRIFVPLTMHTNAKKQIKVVAEARVRSRKVAPTVSASVVSRAPRKTSETENQSTTTEKSSLPFSANQIKIENLTEEQVRKLARIVARKRSNKKPKA